MKKILLFIAILFFSSLASAGFLQMQEQIIMSKQTAACTKDTVDLVMDQGTATSAVGLPVGNAIGQSISYANAWSLYSISIVFDGTTSSCVMSLRIGTSDNLGTTTEPYEEWVSVNIGSGAKTYEFVSVDNDTFTGTITYYIGGLEESGTCAWDYANTDVYAGGTRVYASSGWSMGSPAATNDITMDVNKCE